MVANVQAPGPAALPQAEAFGVQRWSDEANSFRRAELKEPGGKLVRRWPLSVDPRAVIAKLGAGTYRIVLLKGKTTVGIGEAFEFPPASAAPAVPPPPPPVPPPASVPPLDAIRAILPDGADPNSPLAVFCAMYMLIDRTTQQQMRQSQEQTAHQTTLTLGIVQGMLAAERERSREALATLAQHYAALQQGQAALALAARPEPDARVDAVVAALERLSERFDELEDEEDESPEPAAPALDPAQFAELQASAQAGGAEKVMLAAAGFVEKLGRSPFGPVIARAIAARLPSILGEAPEAVPEAAE